MVARAPAPAQSMAPAPQGPPGLPAAGVAMPSSMGLCADEFARVRAIRLEMDKIVEGVKARETELKEYIIANLSKSDDTGAAGKLYRAQIVTKDIPKAADWPQFHAYVAKTGQFDMLQKRLSDKAVMDRLEQGERLPGIEVMHIPDVSITKI